MSTLVERLQAKAPELGRRAIAEMYQNPFWQERFGANGRENSDKDSQFHISYLVQALVASDPGVLTNYARWLQTLLVSRGMCSRHIDENFERLARAIHDEVADAEPALALLRAARQALIYESGPARELMLGADALAARVVDALWSRQPSWFSAASSYPSIAIFESIHQAERMRCKADVLDHIAYLADAIHADRPELFVAHAAWMKGFNARHHGQESRVRETLRALSDCLPAAPGAASLGGVASGSSPRASARPPPRRPPLSQPPPPPVPMPASTELAVRAQAVLGAAFAELAGEVEATLPPAAEGGGR